MARLPYVLPCLLLAACKFGDDRPLGGEPMADASVDGPAPGMQHLLISEIDSINSEFIEIWNPTNQTISLNGYYLSDMGNYWRYPAGATGLGVMNSDFVVRFPDGSSIPSNGVVVVETAMNTVASAQFSINATSGPRVMAERTVPGNVATITNSGTTGGEVVILFYWDGRSDRVKDVDIVTAGSRASPDNSLQSKQPVDGPDGDTIATPYAAESLSSNLLLTRDAISTFSFKRTKLEAGSETQDGNGNGLYGDDETSESLKVTWDGDLLRPLSIPTPGIPPTP